MLIHSRPLVIGVGGSYSGAGKTTVAQVLLKHLSHSASTLKRWGAVKYTKTAFYTSVIDDRTVLDRKDKDTGKLLEAGAEEVVWVRGTPEGLKETMGIIIDRLSHLDGILIEGNSAIEFSNPDIVIFISGVSGELSKTSALRLIKHADIIVSPRGRTPQAGAAPGAVARTVCFDPLDETTRQELTACMETVIEERVLRRIKQLLQENAADNRISCTAARHIADELRVAYRSVGEAADELKIKINKCELGCF